MAILDPGILPRVFFFSFILMKQILLDDSLEAAGLYPFTRTRHAAEIRVGILTIKEKWELMLGERVHLSSGRKNESDANTIIVPANIIPTKEFVKDVLRRGGAPEQLPADMLVLEHPWQIFQFNDRAIREDYELVRNSRTSLPLAETVQVMKVSQVFVEEGAKLGHCMLNATTGPIYIGRNAEVMEGVFIRGPFALGEGAVIKMGARIYGATTIGPYCVAGGEIKNSVMSGYSNKAHDGYLGDSVIGEWCNLGAGTSNSNLKNTAGEIKIWNPLTKKHTGAGQKCGVLMGDYSRAAINTSFNTGTVVGVCCNVLSNGLTEKFIPDFSWGGDKYEFEKAMKDIASWKKMKNQSLTENEIQQLKTIFDEL
jgi:UDP-N-acetylglucosamine diphosphorylase / glucose-1-phosphate thymidylyltransferase / UDP-N-acetylgalactosamine diphosphorylase / glucosamine-1-phosphate N-acetyltransferase / galactosamine-1-phosphate N-acetyltransferase